MKALYSEIKQYLPEYRGTPKTVIEALSLTGILVDSFTEVQLGTKKDYVIGLEVRQNRPDCLGVAGVAREAAAYLQTPFVLPAAKIKETPKKKISVSVTAAEDVKRVAVVEISGLDNSKPTPEWLARALEAHGMNSVSLLVDISNYVMLMTGYPNHIFDAGKLVGGLVWQRMPKTDTFTTLDGTTLELSKGKQLVISDNLGPLVLASAVGGRRSAISERTTSVLAEVAVYDPVKMRADARSLKVVTEASARLEKDLSVEMVPWALEYLVQSFVKFGGGKQSSVVFDYYPRTARFQAKTIRTSAGFIAQVGGVPVSAVEAERILKRLGFTVKRSADALVVGVPSWRTDVLGEYDIAEEVLRMKGFDTIPATPPAFVPVVDVTPPRIQLMDQFRTILPELGFDEVLTLPMTTSKDNAASVWEVGEEVRTQNAINEEFPVLRQSLVSGLIAQQHSYLRKEVGHIALFEIGKVFAKQGKRYGEPNRVGLLLHSPTSGESLPRLQKTLETVLFGLGAVKVEYGESVMKPALANPYSCFTIRVAGKPVGVLYKLQDQSLTGNKRVRHTSCVELDVEQLLEALRSSKPRGATEMSSKLIVLDANVIAGQRLQLTEAIDRLYKLATRGLVWSCEVVDEYQLPTEQTRYTVRVSYANMTDAAAKSLHEQAFPAGVS
ncbi:MAG: phenylalanine--tRNA ligase subunit beta [Candidatus Doudnabacteria bacterium]|nr:phenylalanine--tRNA ligase subunit beta [Candidatus Doudnabacteria bacterium]